ncbi:hydroxyacylglutathione hydrolase [Aliiroseovarius sp. YM-037]|uniref:hydroxyacylglutathione hydrolase n=1 Tax=Aliiroseovarius sp. YM-037 TaxID=3341728 RepID=UPI003A801111
MSFTIETIPCLSDNYAFLIHNDVSGQTALVDAPEAGPIMRALQDKGWTLDLILLTHHHADHIDGVAALQDAFDATVIGAAADAHRLPSLDKEVSEGDVIEFAGADIHVLDVSGHTVGHIAFHMPDANAAFTADSLMALGCGRLFEGTPAQMWSSLSKLSTLPADTLICSGHEYTQANARFALTIEPDNADLISRAAQIDADRAAGIATVPSTLVTETATNPFLRAHLPEVKSAIGMANASDVEVFAEIRKRKDNF